MELYQDGGGLGQDIWMTRRPSGLGFMKLLLEQMGQG